MASLSKTVWWRVGCIEGRHCRHSLEWSDLELHSLFAYFTVPYFFSYKTEFFSFQNKPKDLNLSYKTDLDLWDCLGRENWYYSKISLDRFSYLKSF